MFKLFFRYEAHKVRNQDGVLQINHSKLNDTFSWKSCLFNQFLYIIAIRTFQNPGVNNYFALSHISGLGKHNSKNSAWWKIHFSAFILREIHSVINEIWFDFQSQITFFKEAIYFPNLLRIRWNTIHFIEINYRFIGVSSTTFSSFFIKPQQCSMAIVTRISLPTSANIIRHIPASGIHSSNTFSSSSNICISTKFGPMGMYSALSKPERKIYFRNILSYFEPINYVFNKNVISILYQLVNW